MYSKYIIPVCNYRKGKIYNMVINATGLADCQDRIMNKFQDYSDSYEYNEFLDDLYSADILIGEIKEIDEF